jgi:hypothetical protein
VHWYIAETLPPAVEDAVNAEMEAKATENVSRPYVIPPRYPTDLDLRARCELDRLGGSGQLGGTEEGKVAGASEAWYEPRRHADTGVNEEEANYISELLTVDEACSRVAVKQEAFVIRKGWEYIQKRREMESSIVSS